MMGPPLMEVIGRRDLCLLCVDIAIFGTASYAFMKVAKLRYPGEGYLDFLLRLAMVVSTILLIPMMIGLVFLLPTITADNSIEVKERFGAVSALILLLLFSGLFLYCLWFRESQSHVEREADHQGGEEKQERLLIPHGDE